MVTESVPVELTPAQDRLYFMAWDEVNGYQPWRTDGFADTRMIVALTYSEFGWPHDLTAVDNTLYFNVRQSTSIRAYQSDGTAAGTFAHADAFPRFGGYEYREMTAAPGRLFFVAPHTRAGEEPSAQVLDLLRYDQPQLFLPEGAGVHKRYTIALNLRPQAAVTVQISSDDTLSISPSQVTFTPDNWTRPQTITVGAPGGGPATGTRPATLTHTLATADPLLDGETSALPVLIRNWQFGFVPLVMTK